MANTSEFLPSFFCDEFLDLRYKFNRQTPYDLYAHSNDDINDVEFGVGI